MVGDLQGFLQDSIAAQTHVCYGGFTFYVLNAVWNTDPLVKYDADIELIFEALPGGTFDSMQNPYWANLSLDDLVISSFEGYMKNGMKNGYSSQMNDSYGDNGLLFGDGVRTPGFTSLPLCDLDTLVEFLKWNYGSRRPGSKYPYFPCPN